MNEILLPEVPIIPIPEELPTFIDFLPYDDESTEPEASAPHSPVHCEKCHETFDFEFSNPKRKTRLTTQLTQLVRILKKFNRKGKI